MSAFPHPKRFFPTTSETFFHPPVYSHSHKQMKGTRFLQLCITARVYKLCAQNTARNTAQNSQDTQKTTNMPKLYTCRLCQRGFPNSNAQDCDLKRNESSTCTGTSCMKLTYKRSRVQELFGCINNTDNLLDRDNATRWFCNNKKKEND